MKTKDNVKKVRTSTLPRTKTMVLRSQAAERRILQNKQYMDPDGWRLCERLKAYYTLALTWMGDPMELTGGMTFTDCNDRVHRGIPRLQPYFVEMEREWGVTRRMREWGQMVRIYTFAVFEDGYKVGLRLDIPLLLMNPEEPQCLVQCPPDGDLNALPHDPHGMGRYLIMRCHPTLQCFVPAEESLEGECVTTYADEYRTYLID